MPLIEPLEYKETEKIREFVIAIDTSGSCSNGLIQKFLEYTYSILSSSEVFASKVNIHIIQCDADIKKDDKITDAEEMEDFLSEFTAFGNGGTDFRPVFTYVDELIAKKEFHNLRGLIYFTDGYGVFPEIPPQSYSTAFVFVDEDARTVAIPPWAIKVVLSQDEIQSLEY
jgi:predicted metal-dependent peptidase